MVTPEGTPRSSSNVDTSSIHLLTHLLAHTAKKPETLNLVVVPKPYMCSNDLDVAAIIAMQNRYANPSMPV